MTDPTNRGDHATTAIFDQESTPDQSKQRSRRGGGKRGGRPNSDGGDLQRPGRPRLDRAMVGYGDGIERAYCLGVQSHPPRSFPVQHRSGLAVLARVTVATTESAILLCDGQHDGPHIWPNGDVAGEERRAAAPEEEAYSSDGAEEA